jgi:hypothetical protein
LPGSGIRIYLLSAAGFESPNPDSALKHVFDIGTNWILTAGIIFLGITSSEGIANQTQIVDGHADIGLRSYFFIKYLPKNKTSKYKQAQQACHYSNSHRAANRHILVKGYVKPGLILVSFLSLPSFYNPVSREALSKNRVANLGKFHFIINGLEKKFQ